MNNLSVNIQHYASRGVVVNFGVGGTVSET